MSDLEIIGKYTIEGVLGRGAMGVVYKAFDPNIARTVAVKTIHGNLLSSEMGKEMLERFKTEAQAVGRLTHPNIVGIFDFDQDRGTPYFVMEYVEGKDLKNLIKQGSVFTADEVVRVTMEILKGLSYTHKLNIVHRDIKPANIFITDKGEVKIADFGIARMDDSELTQVGSVLGTPSYMSPEQCIGAGVDARSDLFSVGTLLYEMLTGKKPFRGEQTNAIIHNVINLKPEPPSHVRKEVSSSFDQIIKKALAKNASQRYQTAAEFAADLEKVSSGGRVVSKGQKGGVVAGGVVVAVAIIGVVFTQLPSKDNSVVAVAPIVAPVIPVVVEDSLTVAQRKKVTRLLDVARAHFLVGRLVSPQGSNAYDAYKMVLGVDDQNLKARQGMDEVRNRFFKRTKILWLQGEKDDVRSHLLLAEELFKGEPLLDELRERVQGG
jgi:hypothetical protein